MYLSTIWIRTHRAGWTTFGHTGTRYNQLQLYLSRNTPQYMKEYIDFAVEFLGLYQLRGEIRIDLAKRNLEEEAFGLCWGNRREAEIQIASKQWGKRVSREDKLKTIAHELTHAYQYLKGELVVNRWNDNISRWKDREIHFDPKNETQMPWEVHAIDMENQIYDLYHIYKGYK